MSLRMEKINELIKQQLSILIHNEFAEKSGIISITSVVTTKDLKQAKIYISGIEENKTESFIKKMQEKARDFRYRLGKKITLRDMPRLQFVYDQSQKRINRIEELLDRIEKEKHES